MRIEDEYDPQVGKSYLVPCIVIKHEVIRDVFPKEELMWLDLDHVPPHLKPVVTIEYLVVPIIPHAHSDKENGQQELHYHSDTRFNGLTNDSILPNKHRIAFISRVNKKEDETIQYFSLILNTIKEDFHTSTALIARSKLKHDCIYKGKCPHRGYDLTNTPVIEGVITCPLHNLKFDPDTHKLLNNPTL